MVMRLGGAGGHMVLRFVVLLVELGFLLAPHFVEAERVMVCVGVWIEKVVKLFDLGRVNILFNVTCSWHEAPGRAP